MAIVLTSWVVMSIQWNCLYKTRGKDLLSGRLWQVMVPKRCTEATWGCQSDVSEVLWDISNFPRKHSDICRTPSELPAQGIHCWQILLHSFWWRHLFVKQGFGQLLWSKANSNKISVEREMTGGVQSEFKVGGVVHCPTGTHVPLVSTCDYLKTI